MALEDLPREPRFLAVGLTGQISPRFLNETRRLVRSRLPGVHARRPVPAGAGTNVAMDVGVVDEPIGVSINGARSQVANQHTYQVINNSTWNRDKHTMLFGGTWRREYWFFLRTDQLSRVVDDTGRARSTPARTSRFRRRRGRRRAARG